MPILPSNSTFNNTIDSPRATPIADTVTSEGWSTPKSRGNAGTGFDINFSTLPDLPPSPRDRVKGNPLRRPLKGPVFPGGALANVSAGRRASINTSTTLLSRRAPRRNIREMRFVVECTPERAVVPEMVASSTTRKLARHG
jgi:hypothetical protein